MHSNIKHDIKNDILCRINEDAHIPTELSNDIDFVVGISELIDDTRKTPRPDVNAEDTDNLITPAVLQRFG